MKIIGWILILSPFLVMYFWGVKENGFWETTKAAFIMIGFLLTLCAVVSGGLYLAGIDQ